MKAPFSYIKDRATITHLIMLEIAATWTAAEFITPTAFGNLITAMNAQDNLLSDREAQLALAAGEWDSALATWHQCSVCVTQMARGTFRDTDKAGAWHNVRASGQTRDEIMDEGQDIESAWTTADAAWVPKAGLTLASYQGMQNTALNKRAAHFSADKNVNLERSVLSSKANGVYDLSVQWYLLATGAFPAGTVYGDLIRTIPTQYNPNTLPGVLHFEQHFSPAPSQVELVWEASRAQGFNIYAKSPSGTEFVKILDATAQTSWIGQGLAAGTWAFKGEAINATGTGESSPVVIVPVAAALAA